MVLKASFGGPNGHTPPANPSIDGWGGLRPPPELMGFPEGSGCFYLHNLVLRKTYQRVGWLPDALLHMASPDVGEPDFARFWRGFTLKSVICALTYLYYDRRGDLGTV